jgi:two-component system, NtrC family, sensor kinase
MADEEKELQGKALAKWNELERAEASLWRKSLLVLLLLSLTVVLVASETAFPFRGRMAVLPIALVVLSILFAAYVWAQKREIDQLRGFVHGFAEGHTGPPSDQQLEKLFEVVSRSQHSFRELIDSFDRIAFNLSLDGHVRVINREFAELLGLPFSEIVNHRFEEFVEEPTRADLEKALPRFLEKRTWNGVVRVRWKHSGEVRFYECTLYAVLQEGSVVGASGLARDISAQREAESRFTDLFETLHEGVYFSMPDGGLLDVNPALVKMLGYADREELVAKPLRELFADPSQFASVFAELRESGFLRDREVTLRRKDRTPIHILISCVSIRDASGNLVRVQGSMADITERRQMERRLREEQEFVRRLIACFPDVIVVLDPQGRYSFVSPRLEELLGYKPEEFIGTTLEQRPHPEDQTKVLEFFQSLASGKRALGTVEYRTRHKNGAWRIFRANASPLTDAEGKIFGVVASARDVTESKKLEQQLLQSEKLAAIGQMVSGVAHELNNPLTAILGVSDLLGEKAADDAARRQIELIQKQARKAVELVQGLLMFSRPARPKSQQVRLDELIRRAVDTRKPFFASQGVVVEFDEVSNSLKVDADANQLVQVFANILTNAAQAIASAHDGGRIHIQTALADRNAEILIDDNGPGIPSEIRQKIFDPFFTTRRTSGGSGLGLTICLAILKEQGGSIEAQSSPEGGARFRILMPLSKSETNPAERSMANSTRPSLNGLSILVVEDDEGIRELIEHGLVARGASIEAARSGEEAWKRLSERSYDAVLCDLNLEGSSGMELFDRTREIKGATCPRFMLTTGELLSPDQISALEKKGIRVFLKPFQISELAAALEGLLAHPADKNR